MSYTFEVEKVNITDMPEGQVSHQGGLRMNLDGGCGISACHCSDHPFITISDGMTLLTVNLTPDEAAEIKRTGYFDSL